MEALEVTRNLVLKDDAVSTIKHGILLANEDFIREAAQELLLNNQLAWHHIITILVRDRSEVRIKVLREIFRQQGTGKQGKFTALWVLFKETKFCRTSFNMLLALTKQKLPATIRVDEPMDVDGGDHPATLCGSDCLNIQGLLDGLCASFKHKDWNTVLHWMRVAAAALIHPNVVTDTGRAFLLRFPDKASLLTVIISALVKSSEDKKLKAYLNAWYDIACMGTLAPEYQALLLFSIAQNCMKGVYNNDRGLDTQVPRWDSAAPLKCIPACAVDIETFRGRTGAGNVMKEFSTVALDFKPEFHGCRERSSPKQYVETWMSKGDDFFEKEEKSEVDKFTAAAAAMFLELFHFDFPQSLEDKDSYPHEIHDLCELKLRDRDPNNPDSRFYGYGKKPLRNRSPPENFYDLRDTVEDVLQRAIHLFIRDVLRHHRGLWIARSLRDVSMI